MATIQVSGFKIDGKTIKDVNGKKLKSVEYNGNIYLLKDTYKLTINTNNEYYESAIWNLEKDTYVRINNDYEYVSAGDNKIYAGSKTGYTFDGWSPSTSFNITNDSVIEGTWSKDIVIIGTYEITTRWYGGTVYIYSVEYDGEIVECSLSEGDYWTLGENETITKYANFYNSSGETLRSVKLTIGPYTLEQIIEPVDYVEESWKGSITN